MIPQRLAACVVIIASLDLSACGPTVEASYTDRIDFISLLSTAQRRAPEPLAESIRVERVGPPDDRRQAIRTETPSRLIWTIRLPRRARLSTAVSLLEGDGVNVRFYIGDRTYEQLFALTVSRKGATPGPWQPVIVDLSGYAGWQWSLFYRPSESPWRLSFYADPAPSGVIAWAAPTIQVR